MKKNVAAAHLAVLSAPDLYLPHGADVEELHEPVHGARGQQVAAPVPLAAIHLLLVPRDRAARKKRRQQIGGP